MVERYQPGQVRPRPLPQLSISPNTLRASGAAFGAQQAADVAGFGRAVGQAGAFVQSELDKSAVRDALNQISTQSREFMSDLLSKQGADAVNSFDDAQKYFAEAKKMAHKSLKTPRQQDIFNSSFDSISNSNLDRAKVHQLKETERYRVQTLDAANFNELQDAIQNRYEDVTVKEKLQAVIANTRSKYKTLGNPKLAEKAVRDAVNNFHMEMLNALRQDSPSVALEYLKENREGIFPSEYASQKRLLSEQDLELQAHGEALEIFNSGLPLDKQLEKARKLNPKIASDVETRVNKWNNQKRIEDARREKETLISQVNQVHSMLDQVKDTATAKDVDAAILAVEKKYGSQIPATRRIELRESWYKVLEARDSEKKQMALLEESQKLYGDLMQKSVYDQTAFASADLDFLQGRIAKEQLATLKNRQKEIRENATDPVEDAVSDALKQFNKLQPFTDIAEEGSDEEINMWRVSNAALEKYIRTEAEKLPVEQRTPEKMKAIANQVFYKAEIDVPWGFDETVPLYLVGYTMRKHQAKSYELTDTTREILEVERRIDADAPFNTGTQLFTTTEEAAVEEALVNFSLPYVTKSGSKVKAVHQNIFGDVVRVVGEDGSVDEIRVATDKPRPKAPVPTPGDQAVIDEMTGGGATIEIEE